MFIDTHCHLDDESFAGRLLEILERARAAGVTRFIVPGVGPSCWDKVMAVAAGNDRIFAAPGVHPMRAMQFSEAALVRLEELAPDAVAIGEIGLDYSYDVPREVQQATFRAQLRLAVRLGLPVLIHCRRAFADLLTILGEEKVENAGGVMHAFSGSPEIATECLKLGLCIGVAGPLTFENAVRPLEVVRSVPLERLLLETDAPDLAPVPYRGGPNEPAFLVETACRVAKIKGVSLEEVARTTTATACHLFKLPRM
jgi:TatD DNase family protein